MSTTVLPEESRKIKDYIIKKFCQEVHSLALANKYGSQIDNNKLFKIKRLFLYLYASNSWKQIKFSYKNVPNYINEYMLRSMLEQSKRI